jgi:hypothetical protein
MAESVALLENPQQAFEKVGSADIVVAIPTYNDADTIGPLVKAAGSSLARFSNLKVVLAHADGGSTDSTVARALEAAGSGVPLLQMSYPIYPVHELSISGRGVRGRDSAFRTIFSFAREAGAKACCIVEPDTSAATPEWFVSLIQPVLESEYDLVAPQYQRHKYEGLLVNGLLSPVVRALFGKRLREPIGSDFAFSGTLVRKCLSSDSWNSEAVRQEVSLWISIQTVSGDMRVGQVRLGARPRRRRDTPMDLSSVLVNLVAALFGSMEQTAEIWQRVRSSQPVPTFGLRFDTDPDPAQVDVTGMTESFRIGYENLKEIWSLILPPASLLDLKKISRQPQQTFRMSDELWARTVFDFAVGFRLGVVSRDHLLRALTPLYMGWAASFILRAKELSSTQVEERIEALALTFEKQKPYLISRWRWPDRFMP